MSKVSVIVPVYNVEQYIKRCLKSILDQSWQDFEILWMTVVRIRAFLL